MTIFVEDIKNIIKYHVYVDYTCEENVRPFYVGMGTVARVEYMKRNRKHNQIVQNLGQIRQVVLETFNKNYAFEIEKQFIKELHTFIRDPLATDIVCNITKGGTGRIGGRKNNQYVHSKRVVCYDLSNFNEPYKIYPSAYVAAYDQNIDVQILLKAIKRKKCNKIINNLYWTFHDNDSILFVKSQPKKINCKPVIELNDNQEIIKEFNSITDASNCYKLDRNYLRRLLRTNTHEQMKLKIGHILQYKNEKDKNFHLPSLTNEHRNNIKVFNNEKEVTQKTRDLISIRRSKPVICYQLYDDKTIEFASAKLATKHYGFNRGQILNALHSETGLYKNIVWKFKFIEHKIRQGFHLSEKARQLVAIKKGTPIMMCNLNEIEIKTYHALSAIKNDFEKSQQLYKLLKNKEYNEFVIWNGFKWKKCLK